MKSDKKLPLFQHNGSFFVFFFCESWYSKNKKIFKFQFVVLLHRTTKHVIPRRGEAPTWESPAPKYEENKHQLTLNI